MQKKVIRKLELLWAVDDNPVQTYAQPMQQLPIVLQSTTSADEQSALSNLLLGARGW